jgi:thiol peroxidase
MATTELGPNTVSTVGELPTVGSQAPGWDLVGLKFQPVTDADAAGKRVVLNIFPSIDTGVCQASVRKFNELAAGLDNTTVVNVSVDLPLAQARFCGAEGIEDVEVGSAFRSSFGRDYGVEMADGGWQGMLARAVVVLDTDRTVLHTQLTETIGTEPDYDAAVAALS